MRISPRRSIRVSARLAPASKEGSNDRPDPMAARPLLPRPRTAMKALIGLLIAATLVIGSGCAKADWIDRTLVTVDVTGVWTGSHTGASSGALLILENVVLDLTQHGSTVKGFLLVRGAGSQRESGPVEGTVAGDLFRFRSARGGLEGELTVNGDEMTGVTSSLSGRVPMSFRRVDPSSLPALPPR